MALSFARNLPKVTIVCLVLQGIKLLRVVFRKMAWLRFNRIILERVRCMLVSPILNKVFWVKAIVTATYLINRCPYTSLTMKTLEEV